MLSFPKLKTGAVQQYPAGRSLRFATKKLRFVDGAEQRFPTQAGGLHRWQIQLDQVDESELAEVERFFGEVKGELETFSFTDPMDGAVYEKCCLETGAVELVLEDVMRGQVSLVIRETL